MARAVLTPLDMLAGARHEACKKLPYLAKGLWRLTFVETVHPDLPTLAVDSKWRVHFNPDFVRAEFKGKTLAGDVIHEGLHRILRHEKRGKAIHAEDGARWNRAGDAEINERIRDAHVPLFERAIYSENQGWPERLSAEEYYRHADHASKASKSGQGQSQPGQPGDGDGKGEGDGKEPRTCSGGSGVNGQKAPWEAGDDAPGGVSEAEAEVVRAQVAEVIKRHAEAKGRGTVPDGMLRWAEDFGTPPPIPWRDLVAAQVRYQIDAKRGPAPSYARPSRRMWDSMSLPVHRLPVAKVAIVGDTSGSMGDEDIAKIVASVYDAVETLGQVWAVGCDAAASEVVEVRHIEDLREALRGGGGTDMTVGLAKAAEAAPDAIVCVTDGETPWPDAEPEGIPVTIVLTRGTPSYCAPPAWATVIEATDA